MEHVEISESPTRRRGNDALLSSNVEATFSGAIWANGDIITWLFTLDVSFPLIWLDNNTSRRFLFCSVFWKKGSKDEE